MGTQLTVDSLITEVREQVDEVNTDTKSDAAILRVLNRGQDFATSQLARHYEDLLLRDVSQTLTGGRARYRVPEDAFEERLEAVEIMVGGRPHGVRRRDFRDSHLFRSNDRAAIPKIWVQIGREFELLPTPTGTHNAKLWYLQEPAPMTKSQGRITSVDAANNSLVVDATGADLTTESDNNNSFVNIIDGATGQIKGTLQIQSIAGSGKITFKTTATKSQVAGRAVETDLSSLSAVTSNETDDVREDDYICLYLGTCVPFFKRPMNGYLVQYGVAEISRSLKEAEAGLEQNILEMKERNIRHQWAGREQTHRVRRRNAHWPRRSSRRWPRSES